ncbi:hypothetical protein [Nocardioides nematodiphilus]|uniref:hypothetical protein n=1 Tax=Nocardioides nematodiphilus TaxID=2849669 RepID=UPI001CD97331|nr:hypothetical protein [Nocardioides nematodiphilus]MCA1984797.1 hypothetical protein [Nocardioides nematodiphilus]
MSDSDDRQILSDAISALPGLNCTPYYRQTTRPGDAFVRLARKDREDNGFGMVTTWQVWIILPSDMVAAEQWIDEHHDAIYEVLNAELYLTSATPSDMVLDAGQTNGVIYEGTR